MTILEGKGNLLESTADALVNTVNTVGVMGKGIALQFKKAFPDNYKAYKRACDHGEVVPGHMFTFHTGRLSPRLIVNFPTKRHWRQPSRLEDVREGLADLVRVIMDFKIKSLAIPPLGAGNGGLDWNKVRPLIVEALAGLDGVTVHLFEPGQAPPAREMPVAPNRVKMTPTRAAVLLAFESYLERAFALGRLEAQKLIYFLAEAGQPFPHLQFEKAQFGPYAEVVNHMLSTMDGKLLRGFGDRAQPSEITVLPEPLQVAHGLVADEPVIAERVGRVMDLVEGFEGLYGLELLASVHWAAKHDLAAAASAEAARTYVQAWSKRKTARYQPSHIDAAWRHLSDRGWIGARPALREARPGERETA
jgi:O-acetyl-ADP-ribose deacetylase (regulator of RNase III)